MEWVREGGSDGGQRGSRLSYFLLILADITCYTPPSPHPSVITEMNEHFGSEVALYLSFMDHLIRWLVPPAAFGLLIATVNHLDPDMDVNTNLTIPLFSVFVITWAVLFVQAFKQTCSSLVGALYSCLFLSVTALHCTAQHSTARQTPCHTHCRTAPQ